MGWLKHLLPAINLRQGPARTRRKAPLWGSGRGVAQPHRKISDEQVQEMRRLHEELGITYAALAKQFNVKPGTVAQICQYNSRANAVISRRSKR